MRTLAIVFTGLWTMAVTLPGVDARCLTGRVVSSKNTTGIAYLYTPGHPFGTYGAATSDLRGSFWSLGYGNPADSIPPNNDSGANSGVVGFYEGYGGASNWLEVGFYGYGTYIGDFYNGAHWNYPGTDGCIDFDGSDGDHVSGGLPDGDECNVVLVDDDDDDGGGFFLVAAESATNGDYFLNLALTGGSGSVELAPIPAPLILGVWGVSSTVVNLIVVVPCPTGPADGLYANCSPEQNEALAGSIDYRLYSVTTEWVAPVGPGSRDLPGGSGLNPTGWVPLAGGSGHCGNTTDVTVEIPLGSMAWLCSSLVFDPPSGGGFETTICSVNSIGITTILADPEDPVIHREKPATVRRPGRRDRRPAGGR